MTTEHYQQHLPRYSRSCGERKNNHIFFGGVIIIIGGFILAKRLGILVLPFHIWPLVLLAIGIYTGLKHRFQNFGSWVLITLGILFTIPRFELLGVMSTHLIAPVLLIVLGTYLIVRPQQKFGKRHSLAAASVDEDVIDIDVAFGERSTMVTSKNFKGGTVSNTFSDIKLNLLQADNTEPMVLDLKVSFGELELVIPSHWDVEFQVSNSFSSVEDKRYMRVVQTEDKRTLIIKGTCSFGSVSVKSI